MKTMKKLFALVLAMVMLMALALPVMAAGETYTIQINGSTSSSAESAKNHTYEAYQILKGTVDPTAAGTPGAVVNLGDVHWGENIKSDDLLDALKIDSFFGPGADNMFSSVTTAQQFADVISATTFTTKYVEKLAHILNKHLIGTPIDTTAEAAPPYILDVPAGYYLIKDKNDSLTGMKDKDYTDIILEVSKNVTINHKGSVPTVSKEVSELNHTYKEYIDSATATTFYYKLTGTLPSDFDKYEKYAYKFVDTMGKGIEYLGIEKIYAIYNNGTELVLTAGAEVTYDNANRILTVSFDNLKHDNNKHNFQPGNRIVVVYKAKLNEDAVVAKTGNENKVHLEYSNDPQSEGTGTGITSDDNAKVYTFGIQIYKYDGADTGKKLKDVKFRLYRKVLGTGGSLENEYAIISGNVITGWTKEVTDATETATDEKGIITIHGLDTGVKYYLEETAAAPSYNPIAEPIEFQLTPIKDSSDNPIGLDVTPSSYYNATPDSYKVTEGGTEHILGVTLNIPNSQGAVLPTTGGMGTTLFYVLGSILVIGAVVLLVTKKRMAN